MATTRPYRALTDDARVMILDMAQRRRPMVEIAWASRHPTGTVKTQIRRFRAVGLLGAAVGRWGVKCAL